MQKAYPLFEKCDLLVLASPLYFWTISVQTKSFIDRLYSISRNDKYPSKETMLLMTCGSEKEYAYDQTESFYQVLLKALGWKDKGMVLARGVEGKINEKSIEQKYLDDSYQLGKTYQ